MSQSKMCPKMVTYKHEWKIGNFKETLEFIRPNSDMNDVQQIPQRSSIFPEPAGKDGFQWQLELFAVVGRKRNGIFSDSPVLEWTLYCVRNKSGWKSKMGHSVLEYSLYLLGTDGEKVQSTDGVVRDTDGLGKPKYGKGSYIMRSNIWVSDLFELQNVFSTSVEVTFGCEIRMPRTETTLGSRKAEVVRMPGYLGVIRDLQKLQLNATLSDVTIKVGNRQFPAHKLVLAARSEVFCAMFQQQDFNQTNIVEVADDVEPEVMKEFLDFLYTDETPNMKKWAIQLLMLADRFAIENLKRLAKKELENFTEDNVLGSLVFAHLQSLEKMETAAIEFILNRKLMTSIVKSKEWQHVKRDHPDLVDKIMVKK